MDVLRRLFEQHYRLPAESAQPLQGQLGGSGRAIARLTGGGFSAIGVVYSVREENVAFLEFSRHFRRHGLPVPEIYAEDLSQGAYLRTWEIQRSSSFLGYIARARPLLRRPGKRIARL